MKYDDIIRAIIDDGLRDELFGIKEMPHIPDGSIMIAYFIEPDSSAFQAMPSGIPDSPEGYWFVVHVHTNPARIDKLIYNKQGTESYRSHFVETIFLLIEDSDNWFLVRDLSTANEKLYVRQRSL